MAETSEVQGKAAIGPSHVSLPSLWPSVRVVVAAAVAEVVPGEQEKKAILSATNFY